MNMKEKEKAFIRLVEIMDRLREECPWDKKLNKEEHTPESSNTSANSHNVRV